MGRHRKKSGSAARRTSLIALSGLVPAGLAATTATGTTAAVDGISQPHTPGHTPLANRQLPMQPVTFKHGHDQGMAKHPVQPGLDQPAEVALPNTMAAGPLGVPTIALAAYKNAAGTLATENPGCGLDWETLAGIGRVESHHANDGDVDVHGTALHPIYGPALDGSLPGNEVIGDGAGGYQRAEGPMQFMPGTWSRYADASANPQNLFDAALTAGRYLCDGGKNLRDISQRTQAILRYNNSMAYVANVMAWSLGYATGVAPGSDALPRI